MFGSLKISEALGILVVRTCSGILLPGIRKKLIASAVSVFLVGGVLSLFIKLFIFGFRMKLVFCV